MQLIFTASVFYAHTTTVDLKSVSKKVIQGVEQKYCINLYKIIIFKILMLKSAVGQTVGLPITLVTVEAVPETKKMMGES